MMLLASKSQMSHSPWARTELKSLRKPVILFFLMITMLQSSLLGNYLSNRTLNKEGFENYLKIFNLLLYLFMEIF